MHNILDQYFDVVIGIYILTLFFLQNSVRMSFYALTFIPSVKESF